jgi:predicted ATPase
MIEKIKILNNDKIDGFSYFSNLTSILSMSGEIKFSKGLNIIVGPNGSGKSSVLKAISHHLAANQSGFSIVTEKWLRDMNWSADNDNIERLNSNFEVIHDGQPIVFGDPHRGTGLTIGGIDEEFYTEGLIEAFSMSKESNGEQNNRRNMPFLDILEGRKDFPKFFSNGINPEKINNLWKNRLKEVKEKLITGKIPVGQKTILLDEPESGLSLLNQLLLWNKILKNKEISEKYQIILVSHSTESLNIEHANYIELREGYLSACRDAMKGDLNDSDALTYSTNVQRKLSKREVELLKTILVADGYSCDNSKKTALKLEKIDFIAQRSKKKEYTKKEKSKSKRLFNSFNRSEQVWIITEKGKQFLSFYKE